MANFRLLILAAAVAGAGTAVKAELQICNDTGQTQSVSIGYKGDDDWTSEGWWNIAPGDCATPVTGDLKKRYYYYRAEVDGGDFEGENYFFCTTTEEYTIVGDTECEDRGYDRESFTEIDTGETATAFTYRITEAETGGAADGGEELGLEFCNETAETQSVSVAYEGDDGFVSEGWWNVEPGDCATPLGGALKKRYYYYRTEVQGAPSITGSYNFCTTPEAYTITGDSDCEARGYDTEGFAEIDTGPTSKFYSVAMTTDQGSDVSEEPSAPVETEAGAGLRICNETDNAQELSFGYNGAEGWTSEGWWIVDPGECVEPALDGTNRRYVYYRAEIGGGPFEGQNYFFCTTPEEYTIIGDSDCEARGYDREDFREIDTGSTLGTFTFTLVRDEDLPMTDPGPTADPTPEPEPVPTPEPTPVPGFDFGEGSGTVGEDPEPEPEPEPEVAPEPEDEPRRTIRRGGSRG
ncbi:MAG: DUF1036 domain-containing protein [Rhodobacter sp.]|nr:DUF1036 domain-containing protein [Rhodobacter sp.]